MIDWNRTYSIYNSPDTQIEIMPWGPLKFLFALLWLWLFGPWYALIAFLFGFLLDIKVYNSYKPVAPADNLVPVLLMAAAVMQLKPGWLLAQLMYLRNILASRFYIAYPGHYVDLTYDFYRQKIDIESTAEQIVNYLDEPEKKNMLRLLIGLAHIGNKVSSREILFLRNLNIFIGFRDAYFEQEWSRFNAIDNQGFNRTKAYRVLELKEDAGFPDIRKAYHQLALKYHPDKTQKMKGKEKDVLTKKFIEITKAYRYLIQKEKDR